MIDHNQNALIQDIIDKVSGDSDMDWSEINAKHGCAVSDDHLRKMGRGIKLILDAGMLTKNEVALNSLMPRGEQDFDSENLNMIQQQLDEIYKAKRRLYDQRRVYNKALTFNARAEHIMEILIESANNLPNLKKPNYSRSPFPVGDSEAVLFLSDWHYGMTADNVWNTFNPDVFNVRVSKLVRDTVRYLNRHRPRTLHVVILGDMIEGTLRPTSQIEASELGADQIMKVSEILADIIAELSRHAPKTKVYSTYGNHARTVQKFVDSIHADNLERIIPWWLQQRLKDFDNVEFVDSIHEFIRIDIAGYVIAAVHGDMDSKKGLGPVSVAVFNKLFGRVPDYACMGHVHHNSGLDDLGVETITVGTLSGTDSYANSKRLYATPSQTLMFFNETDGRECRYDILFRDKKVTGINSVDLTLSSYSVPKVS